MITGDNALTACHVAAELGFCNKNALVFDPETISWISVDNEIKKNPDTLTQMDMKDNLCLTGAGLEWMMKMRYEKMKQILPKIKVFARFTPNQKEFVINELKNMVSFNKHVKLFSKYR